MMPAAVAVAMHPTAHYRRDMRALRCGLALCAVLVASCTRSYVATEHGPQAYYQTGWPLHDTSRELEQIFRSVKRLHVAGTYETYRFAAEDRVTTADLRARATYQNARERSSFDHAKAGTATVIGRTERSVRLLTNAHVTRLADTVIAYFDDGTGRGRDSPFVESVAILRTRHDLILDAPGTAQFRVIASDTVDDLALIAVELAATGTQQELPPVLRVTPGNPARLRWGSFVYVLGYPRGYPMVTRAIVSDPRRTRDHAFLLDGLFNRGISGGLILAVRAETGALEWVGVASAASAQVEHLLVPEPRAPAEQGAVFPYDGPTFTEEVWRIDYGITFPVAMATIARFLRNAGHPLTGPHALIDQG
jgi:hypothetical protein